MNLDSRITRVLNGDKLTLSTTFPTTLDKVTVINDMVNRCGRYEIDGTYIEIYWIVKQGQLMGKVTLPPDTKESHPDVLNTMVSQLTEAMLISTKQKEVEYEYRNI